MSERNTFVNFEKLANDESDSVRSSVAANLNTPVSILEKLANDKDWFVRLFLATNPNTPICALEKLSDDVYLGVAYEACKNIKAKKPKVHD